MAGMIKYTMVDAFTGDGLKGNPAAICIVGPEMESSLMQRVATEINVSQTSFVVENTSKEEQNASFHYELRWFSPNYEVALCGHGTLGTAYYLFATKAVDGDSIRFKTKSGLLTARKVEVSAQNFEVELDFPVSPIFFSEDFKFSLPQTLSGAAVIGVAKTGRGDLILELESEENVRELKPNLDEVLACSDFGLIVTAKSNNNPPSKYDFVSRFFAPRYGIDEDPVCGSAHCALAPYWAKKLDKDTLCAHQVSSRGGKLGLQIDWETMRVKTRGEAVIIAKSLEVLI